MLETVTIWMYLSIAQRVGAQVQAAKTQQECIEIRADALKDSDLLLISDCLELKLEPNAKAPSTENTKTP